MGKITATGNLYGRKVTVTVTKKHKSLNFTIDDEFLSEPAGIRFKFCQESLEPIEGHFLFDNNTLRSAFYALTNGFFDDEKYEISVEGVLENIPYEQEKIY